MNKYILLYFLTSHCLSYAMEGGFDPYYKEPDLAQVVEKRIKDGKDLNKPIDHKLPAPLLVSSYSDEHIAITEDYLNLEPIPIFFSLKIRLCIMQ